MRIVLRLSLIWPPIITLVFLLIRLAREHVYGPFFANGVSSRARGAMNLPPDWLLLGLWTGLIIYFFVMWFRGRHIAVTDEGIEDHTTLTRFRLIPWKDIEYLKVRSGIISRIDILLKIGSNSFLETMNRSLRPTLEDRKIPPRAIMLEFSITAEQAKAIERLYQEKSPL